MRRALLLFNLLLAAALLVHASSAQATCAEQIAVWKKVKTESLGTYNQDNPWYGVVPCVRAEIALRWSDPDPEYNDTYTITTSIDGGKTWGSFGQGSDDSDPPRELVAGEGFFPGNTEMAKAFAIQRAKVAAVGKEMASATFKVTVTSCGNAEGTTTICSKCDPAALINNFISQILGVGKNSAGNSPTDFGVTYSSWLIGNYKLVTESGYVCWTRASDISPGWVHNWDKRVMRSARQGDSGHIYELWTGTSRLVFWEDDQGEFYSGPDNKDFTAWRDTEPDPDEISVRYGNRVYTFEEDYIDSNVAWSTANIASELKIYEESSTGFDGYYISYEYDANNRLQKLYSGTTLEENYRLLTFNYDGNGRLSSVTAKTGGDERTVATLTYGSTGSGDYAATTLTSITYFSGGDAQTYTYSYDSKYGLLVKKRTMPSGDEIEYAYNDLIDGDGDSRDISQNYCVVTTRTHKHSDSPTHKLYVETDVYMHPSGDPAQSYIITKRAVKDNGSQQTADWDWYFTRGYFPYTVDDETTGDCYMVYRTEAVDGAGTDANVLWARETRLGFDGNVMETRFNGPHDGGTFWEKTTYEYTYNDDDEVTEVKSRTRRTNGDPGGGYDSTTDYTYADGNDKIKMVVTQGPDGVKQVTEYITVGSGDSEYAQSRVKKTWIEDTSQTKTNEVEYSYYGSGDSTRKFKLQSVDSACCGTTDYDWNADHTLKSVEDALGNKVEYVYSYDDSGSFSRPWKVKRPGQNGATLETVHTYTPTNQVETVTYPPAVPGGAKFVTEYVYDADGRVTEVRRKYGTTTYTYTSRVKYTYATDGSGFLEKIEQAEDPNDDSAPYSDYGYVVVAAYTYDLTGATTSVRNGDGSTGGDSEVQYVYDDYLGRLEKKRVRKNGTAGGEDEADSYFIITTYDYYPNGATWKVTDARSVMVEYLYCDDNNVNDGKLETINFPSDSDIAYTYDTTTGYALRVDQGSMNVLWSYDGFGRLERLTDVWGKQINIDSYDASGKILAWRYPGYSSPENDPIVYAYDDIGRLYKITDKMPAGDDKVTEIEYDQDTGAMVKVTLPNDTVTTLEYDDLGRLTELANAKGDPGETITSYAYTYKNNGVHNGFGQVERITHEDGRFDTFAYDPHERLTKEDYRLPNDPDGDGPRDEKLFRYDYVYDKDDNRYRKEYRGDGSLRVYYSDATGDTTDGEDDNLAPSNRVARAWTKTGAGEKLMGDKINVTGSYTETNVKTIEVEANDSGSPVTATFRDGFYIARGVSLNDSNANTLEVTVTDLADSSTTYPVPPAEHTTKLDRNLDVAYEFDGAGNLKKKTQVVVYNVGGSTTYITRYFYDDANRLEYVDYDWTETSDVHYVYGPTGERVEIQYGELTLSGEDFSSFSASTSRGFVCMGGVVLEEWTVSGGSLDTLKYRYVRNPATDLGGGIASIIYQLDGSDYRYYHYNHKGDTAALTLENTDICAWYEYDAWGNVVTEWEASGVENEFRFSTKQWDAAPAGPPDPGLIYFGARYLDPGLGRWTQLDPAGTVNGLNMYLYLGNSPTVAVDPLGLRWGGYTGLPPGHPPCTPGPDSPRPPRHCAGYLYYGMSQGMCVPVCVLPPGGVPGGPGGGSGYLPPASPAGDGTSCPHCWYCGYQFPEIPECCDFRVDQNKFVEFIHIVLKILSYASPGTEMLHWTTEDPVCTALAIGVMKRNVQYKEALTPFPSYEDRYQNCRVDFQRRALEWLSAVYDACCTEKHR